MQPVADWTDALADDPGRGLREFLAGWVPGTHSAAGRDRDGVPDAAYGQRVRAQLRALTADGADPAGPLTAAVATPVPAPLVDYYQAAGEWPWIMGVNNAVLLPSKLELDRQTGLLVFAHENQIVVRWAVDPGAGSDPPVWLLDGEDGPVTEREPLSRFLVQFAVAETVWGRAYCAHGLAVPPDLADRMLAGLRPLPLGAWRWPADPTRFYAGPGMVALTTDVFCGDGEPEYEVTIGVRHPDLLRPLADLGDVWNVIEL